MQPPEAPSRVTSSAAARLKQALPWLVAAAILWFLFRRVGLVDAMTAAGQADLGVFVPAALVAVTLWFLLESTAFAYLFSRFNAPVTRREARSLRAVTYLLTPINWHLGTGGVVLHLRKSKGIAALEATSSLFFYSLIDGLVLGTLTLVGILFLPPSPAVRTLIWTAGGFVGLQVCILGFFMLRNPKWRWEKRIRALRIFRTHDLAKRRDAAVLLSIRTLYFGCFVLFFWVGTRAFGVHVPLTFMAAAVPVILLAGSIPITPGGLGTQQAAMLYFFRPYGSEAQILAYGLAFPVALILVRVLLGLLYVRDLAALRSAQPPNPKGDA